MFRSFCWDSSSSSFWVCLPHPRQAKLAGDTEMCSFVQQLLVLMGGKVLRKGQLLPFTFWYLRVGYKTHAP